MPQTGLSTCQGSGSCYLQFAPSRTSRLPAVKARRLPGEVGQSRPRADSERLVIFTFVFKRGFAPFHPFASFSLPARSVALGYNLHGNFSLQRSRHKFAGVEFVLGFAHVDRCWTREIQFPRRLFRKIFILVQITVSLNTCMVLLNSINAIKN